MAQVTVNIGGRSYRLACNPGEEPHLEALAGALDAKIVEMRAAFGEIGDQRLAIMAALTIADEASEAKRAAASAFARAEVAEAEALAARQDQERVTQTLTRAFDEMSAKIETLAAALAAAAPGG